ncbi:hypothetical protein A2U01_0062039, partial [Trifolium medium]|nr:hypothetical protein [Trifolium medium]
FKTATVAVAVFVFLSDNTCTDGGVSDPVVVGSANSFRLCCRIGDR